MTQIEQIAADEGLGNLGWFSSVLLLSCPFVEAETLRS